MRSDLGNDADQSRDSPNPLIRNRKTLQGQRRFCVESWAARSPWKGRARCERHQANSLPLRSPHSSCGRAKNGFDTRWCVNRSDDHQSVRAEGGDQSNSVPLRQACSTRFACTACMQTPLKLLPCYMPVTAWIRHRQRPQQATCQRLQRACGPHQKI